MSWLRRVWARLTWPLAALSTIERDLSRVVFAQVEIITRLKEIKQIMAADRELLTQLATDLSALATPVQDLIASEASLRARVVELEGQAAADEAGDLAAAQSVKAAFDQVAAKFQAEPEVPDVEPLPGPEPITSDGGVAGGSSTDGVNGGEDRPA